jgi:hypothetical protein
VDGGGRDRDRYRPAILVKANREDMVDAFSTLDTFKDLSFLVQSVRGKKDGDGFADHLFGGVANDTDGGGVPALDGPVEVFGNDRIVG